VNTLLYLLIGESDNKKCKYIIMNRIIVINVIIVSLSFVKGEKTRY